MTPSLSFLPTGVRTAFDRPMRRAADGNCSSPPLAQLLIEEDDVVTDAVFVQELIKLLVIDAVRALDLAIQMWRPGANVDVPDVALLEMPVEP